MKKLQMLEEELPNKTEYFMTIAIAMQYDKEQAAVKKYNFFRRRNFGITYDRIAKTNYLKHS